MPADRKGGLRAAPLTPEQKRLVARMEGHAEQFRQAQKRIDSLWAKRVELYLAARELDPPLGFQRIADVFGISAAAVQQMHDKAKSAAAG